MWEIGKVSFLSMRLARTATALVTFIFCVALVGCDSTTAPPGSSGTGKVSVKSAPPLPALKDGDDVVVIETEGFGKVKLRLFSDVAPRHVDNFKKLIGEHFYDGLAFHRVVPNLIIQGGDPTTRGEDRSKWGMGTPGQPTIKAEFNDRPFVKGTLGAARSQDPDSASSQFFICVTDYPQWNGQYTNFGEVIEGLSNVQVMSNAPTEKEVLKDKIVITRMYLEKYKAK